MTITIEIGPTDHRYNWGSDGSCYFKINCDVCSLNHTALCDNRYFITRSLNITSFPYILDTNDYPEYLI